ncbi:hypothetical protein SD80_012515 [Scytonema tolypothrichoides VB-61278]|nr:hypothetical protein SD80_012515 [Scytonema tolypothrichoides VB-61278]
MQERDLHTWLKNWILTAPEDEIRCKFIEILPYLTEEDIAYKFYQEVIKDYPVEEIDPLIE